MLMNVSTRLRRQWIDPDNKAFCISQCTAMVSLFWPRRTLIFFEDSTDACISSLYSKPQVHSCTLKSIRIGFAFGQNIILIWRILRSDDIDLRTSFEFQIRCCKPRVHFKLQKFDKNRLLILLWSCIIAFVEQSVGLTALALIAFFGSRQRFGIGGCSY